MVTLVSRCSVIVANNLLPMERSKTPKIISDRTSWWVICRTIHGTIIFYQVWSFVQGKNNIRLTTQQSWKWETTFLNGRWICNQRRWLTEESRPHLIHRSGPRLEGTAGNLGSICFSAPAWPTSYMVTLPASEMCMITTTDKRALTRNTVPTHYPSCSPLLHP